MLGQRELSVYLYLFLVPVVTGLAGCARPEQPAVEAPPPAQPASPPAPPPPPSPTVLPKPQPAEIQAKINSVYQGTVNTDNSHDPAFLVGDFNGDLSQDVAIVVKPVDGKLEEINHEFANWMRGDPLRAVLPNPKVVLQEKRAGEKVRIERGDILLAVIHGYGPEGWRNREATQTYLLRNSVGSDMRTQSKKDLIATAKKGAKLPSIGGDVLRETLGGRAGFVYYNGARYLWFDPTTYKVEAPHRSAH